jgi:hypothetical protein
MSFKEDTKRVRIPALAGFDHFAADSLQQHPQCTTLDEGGVRFLPGKL